MPHIGIDLGGTKISAALIDDKMKVLKRHKILLEDKERKYVLRKIIEIVENLIMERKKSSVKSIGIGVPGISKNGKIIMLPNLQSINGVNIKKILEKRFRIRTFVDNDANCFALGESKRLGKKSLVGITLGTGFGGGIVIDGRIYHGLGFAGEFGHMTLFPEGRKCSCGNVGCLEEYASARAIEKDAENIYGEKINPESLANMARKGDGKAKQIFEFFGRNLGIGLANINNILNPEIISIGGGISKAHDVFMEYAMEEMRKRSFMKVPKIVIGKTEGAIGAAIMGFSSQ